MKVVRNLLIFLSLSISLNACWVYSFTGASIPPDAKTVSVAYFNNRATLVQPTFSQDITEALKDRLNSETSLDLIERDADLQFKGEITGYRTSPSVIASNEQAAQNRLTITVKIKYINEKDKTKNFEQTFSEYADFESSQNFESIEQDLDKEIIDKLVDDIFNKALVNW